MEDNVVVRGELGESVVYDCLFDEPGEKEFLAKFDILGRYLTPHQDFYQGLEFIRIIRRKSDGKLYGFMYWDDISKYGESDTDGYVEWDDENEESLYIFKPVKEIYIKGYGYA